MVTAFESIIAQLASLAVKRASYKGRYTQAAKDAEEDLQREGKIAAILFAARFGERFRMSITVGTEESIRGRTYGFEQLQDGRWILMQDQFDLTGLRRAERSTELPRAGNYLRFVEDLYALLQYWRGFDAEDERENAQEEEEPESEPAGIKVPRDGVFIDYTRYQQ